MSSSLSACLARATAEESSAATARASSTEPAAWLSSFVAVCGAGCAAAAGVAAVVVSSSSNSSQLSMAVSPDWGPARPVGSTWWLLVCTQKRTFCWGRAVVPCVPVFFNRSGLGRPGVWLVVLPLTLALSPEGRGDGFWVASGLVDEPGPALARGRFASKLAPTG